MMSHSDEQSRGPAGEKLPAGPLLSVTRAAGLAEKQY